MTYQDNINGKGNGRTLQLAIERILPKEALRDIKFRGKNWWKAWTLAVVALMWMAGEGKLTRRFQIARNWMAGQTPPDQQPGRSYSGFLKRLKHWSEELKNRIVAEYRKTMAELAGFWMDGWLLLAADGSRTKTPRTQSNQERFSSKKKHKAKQAAKKNSNKIQAARRRKKQTAAACEQKASTPQMWLTMLYHVGLGLPWDWRHGASGSSEREHVTEMAQQLPEHAMLVMDAGFVGFDFWQNLNARNVAFVARVGSNVKLLQNLGCARTERDIVYVWPDKAQRNQVPPVMLRLACFRDGKEDVHVVTNVLDCARLSDAQLQKIYALRWGVELYFRDFKQTFSCSKLLSKCADNAELELDWSILSLWLMCLYTALEHSAVEVSPSRRSVSGLLHAFRCVLTFHRYPPEPGEDLRSLLVLSLPDSYHRLAPKTRRRYPVKKKKARIGSPQILPATPDQQQSFHSLPPAA